MMSDNELYLRDNIAFCEEMLKKHKHNDSLCAKFSKQLEPFKAQLDELLAYKEKQNSLAAIMPPCQRSIGRP
ncbi:hypothetical protein SAMN05421780_108173 [Flexibacter flexilis DSM 6793]|uniref:Uncharacterized protein n=1 Tax=Flexibacter flexilis DSM 6793 TaxID=927664 RepID=A0A1I1LIQ5_9BACT|nr:hypothetical protein [Flexibacter flexilis]SFC70858.1 hypothetical protein SAMN05421780_108173 [Flexibacter flexilis DSM 6793]